MNTPIHKNGKNWLEWTVFALSGLLIAAVLVILGIQAAESGTRRAVLDVELGEPTSDGVWLQVPLTVTNRGGRPAEKVQISVTAIDGKVRLDATCSFDFVPGPGKRRGFVVFHPTDSSTPRFLTQGIAYTTP